MYQWIQRNKQPNTNKCQNQQIPYAIIYSIVEIEQELFSLLVTCSMHISTDSSIIESINMNSAPHLKLSLWIMLLRMVWNAWTFFSRTMFQFWQFNSNNNINQTSESLFGWMQQLLANGRFRSDWNSIRYVQWKCLIKRTHYVQMLKLGHVDKLRCCSFDWKLEAIFNPCRK